MAVLTNGAACSPKIGPWPPFGTIQSDESGIPRNNSTACSTGYSGSRSPCTSRVFAAIVDKGRRGEVHVVAIVGELARMAPQRANLIVTEVMPAAHLGPLSLRSSLLCHRLHDGARLIGKARRAADMNHGDDPLRLLRGHVQQRVRAGAQADRLDTIDAEMIEQREDVSRNVGELEVVPGIWRTSVSAQIGCDDAMTSRRFSEDVLPVITASGESMQEQQWFSAAALAIAQWHASILDAVGVIETVCFCVLPCPVPARTRQRGRG